MDNSTNPLDSKTNNLSAQLATLKTASDYAYSVWQKQQVQMKELLAKHSITNELTQEQITTLIATHAEQPSVESDWATQEKHLQTNLRHLRHLLMCRWIWQDALGLISVPQLTQELSWFADSCLQTAKDFAYQKLTAKYGTPCNRKGQTQDLIIVAMGKHGAEELNLSSDIDLVFVYAEDGETVHENEMGHESDAVNEKNTKTNTKTIETKRFMMLWGQHIIKLIDTVTPDGFVFRVDMRLRPWGDGSDLVSSFKTLTNYFQKHGRAWERFAWLKARAITGDAKQIEQLNQNIKQFVFRYYVDYTAFSALREMKQLIMQQQRQRADEDNVKLGAGGIRDIEFIVQAHQLIHGGRKVDLQVKHCLSAMQALHERDMLMATSYQQLKSAYLFLRRVEHAIQAIADKQTQQLPKDADTQARIANVLGYSDWQTFLEEMATHRLHVTRLFSQVVADREIPDEVVDEQHADIDQAFTTLNADLQTSITAFFDDYASSSKISQSAKDRLQALAPELKRAIALSDKPDIATERVLKFIESLLSRSIYLVLLKENPDGTAHLVRMMTASPWIADELSRYPVLLDEFLLNRKKILPTKTELQAILRERMLRIEPHDEEAQISALRFFKKTQVLHVASKDILADKALMQVSDGLTWIAEAVLTQTLQSCYALLVQKHGFPKLADSNARADYEHSGFSIIGYGKVGGIELNYSSDLDLVFLHGIDEMADTDGEKSISGMKFASRLAKKMITMLSTQTRDGRAYEIDMRLRPSGASGVMVSSLTAFENYQQHSAWVWEHQALVRARALCGDTQVISNYQNIRHNILCQARTSDDKINITQEVQKMRTKMRDHLGSSEQEQAEGLFNLKHDAGGIVDIEFIAQHAVLTHSHEHPRITTYPDNVRIFEMLAEVGTMPKGDANTLTSHYLQLRRATHKQALANAGKQVLASEWADVRADVMGLWEKYVL